MSDLPTSEKASKWERLKFEFIGWLACLFTGNLWKYDILIAQAKYESGYYSSRQFKEGRNAFGMMYPDPYAQGSMTGADGQMARYSSWWKTWRGRLAWDDRRGISATYGSLREYLEAVQQAGYNSDPAYVDRVLAVYEDSTPWLVKFVNAPVEPGGWFGKWRVWFWLVMLFALILTILYLWKPWKRKRAN